MSFEKNIKELENIKLNKASGFPEINTFNAAKTRNPVDALDLTQVEIENESQAESLYSHNLKMVLIVCFLVGVSLLSNSFLSKSIEPAAIEWLSTPFKKPYVLTFGEFNDFSLAKLEAIRLLPELKQINIKKLDTGTFTFEIERFSSKKKAYQASAKLKQDGFEAVHVRYLQD